MIFAVAIVSFILLSAFVMMLINNPREPNKDYIDRYIKKYYNLKQVDVKRYFVDQTTDYEKTGLEIFNKDGDRIDVFTFGYSDLLHKNAVKSRIKERARVVRNPERLLNPYEFLLSELEELKLGFPMLLFHVRTTDEGKMAYVRVENVLTGDKNVYFKTELETDAIKNKITNVRKNLAYLKYADKEDIV